MVHSPRSQLLAYEERKQALVAATRLQLQEKQPHHTFALSGKKSSNLFRVRTKETQASINVRDFTHVISIDKDAQTADIEGMTTYETIVEETLKHNLLPTVVPELKSITIGGATTGIGIESSSFRYGLVHETILEMDILLGTGEVVTCTPINEYKELFFGFPNSYGTLGYALRLKITLIPAKAFVKIERRSYTEATRFFQDLETICRDARATGSYDYIDGVVFDEQTHILNLATFVDEAPFISDYTYQHIYYKSIPEKTVDYLTASDYIWRWDTDWFWCSRFFGVEHPLIRRLLGRKRLRSTTYWKFRQFFEKHGLVKRLEWLRGRSEPVIQDVEIPVEHASTFLSFFHQEIGIKPVWVCPTMAHTSTRHYDLYAMDPNILYINFGFWDGVKSDKETGYYNRRIEQMVKDLHGKKSLYSTSFYTPEEFWQLYNKIRYTALKHTYDPAKNLKDLYQKCVLRK